MPRFMVGVYLGGLVFRESLVFMERLVLAVILLLRTMQRYLVVVR